MKHNREFEIAWLGLKPGEHIYTYELDDKFMQEKHEDEEFKNWNAKVTLKFDKQNSFFLLHFDVDGAVTVPCDRCGQDFDLRLWDEFDLVVKLTGEDAGEIDDEDDVVFIPRNETVIDISNWLYEYVMLSVPLQHIHPDKADGTPGCDPQVLNLLDKLTAHPEEEKKNDIWKGLEALKQDKKVKGK
jgi:uncharacterized metal-binding protein YceD (DUF177 family)